ncbi:MAG: hypothetical protein KDK48_03550 [Chlamydiia bacterium]|nr:hypothetical protein [Chlamydiia bacterium]
MIEKKKKGMLVAAGILWLGIGLYLTAFGSTLLAAALPQPTPFKMWTHPLLEMLSATLTISREEAAALIVAGCILTGTLKAKYVLSRSVKRGITRIAALPQPASIFRIYDWKYYLLIAVMMTMGLILRKSGLPTDFRAACYLSIGFALVSASKGYFRESLMVRDL